MNSRNAKHIFEGYLLDLPNEAFNFWVLWAKSYLPYADGWKKVALEETNCNLIMPEIIIGMQFEAELVDYVKIT